jgi:hypothetical protein
MELKDVLLTDEEMKQIYRTAKLPTIRSYAFEGEIAKAQCLKLIEAILTELVITKPLLLDEMINRQSYD